MKRAADLDDSTRRLARALARRARGRAAAITYGPQRLGALLRSEGLDVQELDLAGSSDPNSELARVSGPFKTVLFFESLEHLPRGDLERVVGAAYDLLEPGGRLVATVPNKDVVPRSSDRRRFSRRHLSKLLAPLGKPRLATDQPYRWLVMSVERPRKPKTKVNRTRRDRYRVTARLCSGRVLELGCGEGHLSKMVARRGAAVTGVDINAEKIAAARACYPELEFIQCDIRALELEPESFDTVVIAEVLEHVGEDSGREMLRKAWELLRPGGRLVVSVPNQDCIPHPNHVREFDRRGLKRLLEPFGKPRLVADQPYKWLLMHVKKRRS